MAIATPSEQGQSSPPETTRAQWWALAALTASVLVVGLDSYILYTALPTLSSSLGASTTQLQWIQTAYTLTWAGLLLPIGKLGDRIGLRLMLLAGLLVFGVSSVLASQADSAGALIALRATMGAGAAVIMPMVLALLPALFPDAAARRKAVAVTTIGAMLGLPLGPLLAGWLLTHFSWGSVFLINGPVVLVSLIGVFFLVPESKDPAKPRIDWLGAVLSAAGVMGVVYGIIEQPTYGWDTQVLAPLIGGVVLIAVFLVWQRRVSEPLVDLKLLRNRTFTWGTVAFAVISFSMSGIMFIVSPFLQVVLDNDPQGTGLRLLPMIGAVLAGAGVSDKYASRFGTKAVLPFGMVVSAVGLVLLTLVHADSGYGPIALALVVFGLGLGVSMPLAADSVLDALAPEQTGMGNALSRTMQSFGSALGAASLGSLLNGAFRGRLDGTLDTLGLTGAAHEGARSGIAGAHSVAAHLPGPAGHTLARAANRAYAHGMLEAALTSAAMSVLGGLLVFWLLPKVVATPSASQPEPAMATATPDH